MSLDGRPRSPACERLEGFGGRPIGTSLVGGADDRLSQRMLRVPFHGRRQREQARHVDAARGLDCRHDGLAARQRAGLVEDDHVQLPAPLEREPVLNEQAVSRAEAR